MSSSRSSTSGAPSRRSNEVEDDEVVSLLSNDDAEEVDESTTTISGRGGGGGACAIDPNENLKGGGADDLGNGDGDGNPLLDDLLGALQEDFEEIQEGGGAEEEEEEEGEAFLEALEEEILELAEQAQAQAEEGGQEGGGGAPVPPGAAVPPAIVRDPSMELSDEERDWALEVKRAVLANEDLLPLTDFEYVLYALVAEGNLEQALWRIERMQDFYQHYNLRLTVEEGLECIVGLMEQQPGFMLHIDVDPTTKGSINVIDIGAFDPAATFDNFDNNNNNNRKQREQREHQNPGREINWRKYITGIHYMKWCAQPTFATIRTGFYALADFGGVQAAVETRQLRMFRELLIHYPFKWQSFMAFNTGYVANICVSVMKSVVPEPLRSCIQVGCQVSNDADETRCPTSNRLSDFYLQPNREEAYRHMILKVHSLLEQRVHNMATFRL